MVVGQDGKVTVVEEDGEEPPTGTMFPMVFPEDWALGAWCYRQGLKVGATRKVRTFHAGQMIFDSHAVWGPQQDEVFMSMRGIG